MPLRRVSQAVPSVLFGQGPIIGSAAAPAADSDAGRHNSRAIFMYLDFSLKKIAALTLLVFVMLWWVQTTLLAKNNAYGNTPFFHAVSLFTQEISAYGVFSLEHITRSNYAAVRSLFTSVSVDKSKKEYAKAVPVLTYHRLVQVPDGANITVTNFRSQMHLLKERGWQTVTLADYEAFMRGEKQLPEKSFLLTFDDGAQQSFYPVDPILKILGYNAVSYIIVDGYKRAGEIGSTYYMSEAEIKRMLSTGRWEIGSHSYDGHRPYAVDAQGTQGNFYADLLWIPEQNRLETPEEFSARVKADMQESRSILEKAFNVKIDTFAFPLGETGQITAGNFDDGIRRTNEEARTAYTYGFLQTHPGEYSYNYPEAHTFFAKRIHVDHDWTGERLLQIMQNGMPKDLPYADDFGIDAGWIVSWGGLEIGFGKLTLTAEDQSTSASTILDGSFLWNEYELTVSANWHDNYALLLGDAEDGRTYRACAFFEGGVRIQEVADGKTNTLAVRRDPNIQYGNSRQLGMRVEDGSISCFWYGQRVVGIDNLAPKIGGIGVQTWDELEGTARLELTNLSAQKIDR